MNEITKWFFNDWCKYRAGLREIWASFDQGMKELEPMKGSKHYIERCEELTTERDNAIDSLADSASRLLKLEKPDSRRERLAAAHRNKYEHKQNYDSTVFGVYWVDQDVSGEDEALNLFGGIAPDQIADFKEAVNR